jgi:hypothetical protein
MEAFFERDDIVSRGATKRVRLKQRKAQLLTAFQDEEKKAGRVPQAVGRHPPKINLAFFLCPTWVKNTSGRPQLLIQLFIFRGAAFQRHYQQYTLTNLLFVWACTQVVGPPTPKNE